VKWSHRHRALPQQQAGRSSITPIHTSKALTGKTSQEDDGLPARALRGRTSFRDLGLRVDRANYLSRSTTYCFAVDPFGQGCPRQSCFGGFCVIRSTLPTI
jgi:hypothetical protein